MNKNTKIQLPLDIMLLVAARSSSYQQYSRDNFSRYFLTTNFYYVLLTLIEKITGLSLQELILKRFTLIQQKINNLLTNNSIDVVIHLSGALNTHLLNIWYNDLKQNRVRKKYILTDIKEAIKIHNHIIENVVFNNSQGTLKPELEYHEFDVFKHNLTEILYKAGINPTKDRILILTEGLIYYLPKNYRKKLFQEISRICKMNEGKNYFLTDLQEFDFVSLLKRRKVTGIKKIQNNILIQALEILLTRKLQTIFFNKEEIEKLILENNLEIVDHSAILVETFDPTSFSIISIK